MIDLPYLMQDPVKDELWLVTSETRLLITPEIYDLLASNGAELPDAYGIKELREQNAKLRELVRDYDHCTMHADCAMCEYDGKLSTHCPLSPCFPDTDELRELGIEVTS